MINLAVILGITANVGLLAVFGAAWTAKKTFDRFNASMGGMFSSKRKEKK